MTTECAIGIELSNGRIHGVTCYYDGYLYGTGRMLLHNYRTEDAVEKLINLGNIVFLGVNIWATEYFIRDKNEPHQKDRMFENYDDFERYYNNAQYFYLFKQGEWQYHEYSVEKTEYRPLKSCVEIIE